MAKTVGIPLPPMAPEGCCWSLNADGSWRLRTDGPRVEVVTQGEARKEALARVGRVLQTRRGYSRTRADELLKLADDGLIDEMVEQRATAADVADELACRVVRGEYPNNGA